MEKSQGFSTSAFAFISVTKLLPGVDTQVYPWCISFLGCLASLTVLCLMWHPLCPTMPPWEASGGALAHPGGCPSALHRQLAAPWCFCSQGQHRAALFIQLQTLNRAQLERKSQDQRLPPYSLSTTMARDMNFLIAKGEAWKPHVTDFGWEFLQLQEKHGVFQYRRRKRKDKSFL